MRERGERDQKTSNKEKCPTRISKGELMFVREAVGTKTYNRPLTRFLFERSEIKRKKEISEIKR